MHPVAAADVGGERTLRLTARNDHHGLYDHPDSPTVAEARISAAPLDDLVDVPTKLIKVDVEGAEVDVLKGMGGLLRGSPGVTVIVEWNPDTLRSAGRLPSEVPRVMQELGIGGLVVLDDWARRERALADVLPAADEGPVPFALANLKGAVSAR